MTTKIFTQPKEIPFKKWFKEEQQIMGNIKHVGPTDEAVEEFDTTGLNAHVLAVVCVMLVHNRIRDRSPNISDISKVDLEKLTAKDWKRYDIYIKRFYNPVARKPRKPRVTPNATKRPIKVDTKAAVRKNAIAKAGTVTMKILADKQAKESVQYARHIAMFNRYLAILQKVNVKLVKK
jgi:hypothetical protein